MPSFHLKTRDPRKVDFRKVNIPIVWHYVIFCKIYPTQNGNMWISKDSIHESIVSVARHRHIMIINYIHGAQAREILGNAILCKEEATSLAGQGGASSRQGIAQTARDRCSGRPCTSLGGSGVTLLQLIVLEGTLRSQELACLTS